MLTRAITGFFFIIVLIGSILLGEHAFVCFFTLLGSWCLYEFYGMVSHQQDVKPIKWLGVLLALSLGTVISLYSLNLVQIKWFALIFPLICFTFIIPLYDRTEKPFHTISYTLAGISYTAIPFFLFIALGFIKDEFVFQIPLGFLILLWSNDTGAYLAGRSLGKRKLFERISPNKTWEGFVGGVFFTLGISQILAHFWDVLIPWQWAVIALIIGIFGTLGDLVESMLKRSLGVKDSGKILPGHGGLLDRFDGLLIAAPLVFLFLLFIL